MFQQLRKDLEDKFYSGTFSWVNVLPHDAAALLKQFLRELPHPLLTHEYIEAFAQVESMYIDLLSTTVWFKNVKNSRYDKA